MPHRITREEASRLRHLAEACGGVPKLSDALSIHRSTLYRYMGASLEVPHTIQIAVNYLAEHQELRRPFDTLPPLDKNIRKFLDSQFQRRR